MTGATGRYGPISFAVALAHILVVEFATWLCVLSVPPLAVFVLLVSLIYLSISSVVAKSPGKLGQVGWGMLIGTVAAPLSLAILIAAILVTRLFPAG
ncbi:hypothetical protein OSH31_19315 [Mycobacterium ulcerans]|nr:hypothetical protein [Mycobacterium ulcerans]